MRLAGCPIPLTTMSGDSSRSSERPVAFGAVRLPRWGSEYLGESLHRHEDELPTPARISDARE